MKPEAQRESFREAWLPVIALIALFTICVSMGFVALAVLGPGAGLVAAILGLALYAWLGPPPMPGLLPGVLAILMLGATLSAAIASAINLIR